MSDQSRHTREDATDNPETARPERGSVEDNPAQRQSDATPDVVAGGQRHVVESSDREDGRGSSANGTTAFDEADGELRRKAYDEGAEIVSRID